MYNKRMLIPLVKGIAALVSVGVMVCMVTLPAQSDLVAHWTFDDVNGITVPNSAGPDDNGKLHENAVISPSDAPLPEGSSHALDLGSKGWAGGLVDRDAVHIKETGNLSPGEGPWSITMWFKTRNVQPIVGGVNKQIVYSDSGPTGVPIISLNFRADLADSMYFEAFFRTGEPKTNTQKIEGLNLQPNVWYHIAVVRDGDNVKVYFDGKLVGDNTDMLGDLGMFEGAVPIIGGANRSVNGLIDDVRIYNHALTAIEIEEMTPVNVQGKLAATWGQIKNTADL